MARDPYKGDFCVERLGLSRRCLESRREKEVRRNFPSGGDWMSRDKQANMAVNSAMKTDALLRIR